LSLAPSEHRSRLRLRSLGWALLAAASAGIMALAVAGLGSAGLAPASLPTGGAAGLDQALRAAGCGFFYGLLAFHLQRVDPDDGHLQAGLVGAVCGIRSLASAPTLAAAAAPLRPGGIAEAMMELAGAWLPLWLPLVGSALAIQALQRLLPSLRP
jgi:hypothetical protein